MLNAIDKEIKLHTDSTQQSIAGMIIQKNEPIESIYFGGGTPSILNKMELEMLMQSIRENYSVSPSAEITLEANPDDINGESLRQWKAAGINRLSIGVQSFFERDLVWMNRSHSAGQALASVKEAIQQGFKNFSADLIFGIPGLSDAEFIFNIRRLIELKTPHIAAYALTVEPSTALQKMISLKKKEDVNNETQARQFEILMQEMENAGYEHYEISNFALPGFRSHHNSSYWQRKKYLGIGPSAHSYDGTARYWNIDHNPKYIDLINHGKSAFESEILTPTQMHNEYVMTSLRTIEGLSRDFMESNFSKAHADRIALKASIMNREWFIPGSKSLVLSRQGKLFADRIASDLFI